jgi:hypothetical protein
MQDPGQPLTPPIPGSSAADQTDSEDDEEIRAMKSDHRRKKQRMEIIQEAFTHLKDR